MESKKWRRLDNTANIFPVIASKHITNVYRIACMLKEDVDKEILEKAVNIAARRVDAYNVRLKKGFFWYYFEKNNAKSIVKEEEDYPCMYIDPNEKGQLLYRITYYRKRINLEISHMLTDGTGAMNFLKEIVKHYFLVKENKEDKSEYSQIVDETKFIIEDSYLKNYTKVNTKSYKSVDAFKIRGIYLPYGMMRVTHGNIDIKSLKALTKSKQSTISEYLVANLIWTIYRINLNNPLAIKPIKVSVPVNLRTYFESNTTLNFFSFIPVSMDPRIKGYIFDDILDMVKEQFKEQLSKEKMVEKISYNVSHEKKKVLRMLPLFIKKYGIKAIYFKSLKSYTITLSNLGLQKMDEYSDKIDKFEFIFEPTVTDPVKIGVVSYGEKVVVSITSILANTNIEREFFRNLSEKNVDIEIESNGVENEKM